ncbi:MAG: hypothetical protein MRY74_07850 [Neomegalonema sp.]|nr:hypothetical protein [Neomegalonema sp.]
MQLDGEFARRLSEALGKGDWPRAETLLRKGAAIKGAPATIFYNLAQVLVRANKSAEAGEWYLRAVATDPDYANAWCELGAWRAERHEPLGAYEAYNKALELAPADLDALLGAAQAATRLGDWAAAQTHWRALAARRPSPETALGLLRVALETGDPAAAEMRAAIARTPALRPALIKLLTRTGRGSTPLRPQDL